MTGRGDIPKLEALLARVQLRAQMPRRAREIQPAHAEAAPVPTVPPTAEAHRAIETEMRRSPAPPPVVAPPVVLPEPVAPPPVIPLVPAVEASATRMVEPEPIPMESRAQLVEEPQAELIEIDESELVAAGPAQEIVIDEEAVEVAPPSSKRPIPMEAIAEAQAGQPPPPPPPESGKLIAAVPAFDDDFTGVREATHQLPPLEPNEPPIEIQAIEPPKPAARHEMEADISEPPPPVVEAKRISDVAPVPPPLPVVAATEPLRPVTSAASLPSGAAVAVVSGEVAAFAPQTFGELLDATLGL